MKHKIRGCFSVMVTPFGDDGAVNEASLRRYVEWQIVQGIHGLIPLGSTGEFLSMSDEEKTRVASVVIDQTKKRVPVLVGTGAESTDDVIRYSVEAERLGADGVMIIPPFYSTPTEDELFEHYRRIGDKVGIPIMIYNNPATANVDMTPRIVARLSEIDNVKYIKESTMDVTRIRDILEFSQGRITVFGGIMGYESFLEGAEGWVSVGSNILPEACAALFVECADKLNVRRGREIYHQITPLLRLVGGHRYVSATKTALNLMGFSVGKPRPPRLPSPRHEIDEVAAVLNSVGVALKAVA
ncbi:MAG: dihydrodipicolinate synthase family protein [Reyranellaceae bacterium]